jgi:hypothetical protein
MHGRQDVPVTDRLQNACQHRNLPLTLNASDRYDNRL